MYKKRLDFSQWLYNKSRLFWSDRKLCHLFKYSDFVLIEWYLNQWLERAKEHVMSKTFSESDYGTTNNVIWSYLF